MSSYTPHMGEDQELYRGVLAYEHQPVEYVPDPNGTLDYYGRVRNVAVPSGPKETKTDIIGPYNSTSPIKAYITRHRKRYENLRIVRIEKNTGWEEVTD